MTAGRSKERAAPDLTIGVPAAVAEEGLAAALDLLHASAARASRDHEIVVAVNGPGERTPAMAGVGAFAERHALDVVEEHPEVCAPRSPASGARPVRVLRLAQRGKATAWNAIRRAARSETIVFADADVRVEPEAIGRLLARLETEPDLALVGGREMPLLGPGDGLVGRIAALPYRFVLANVPGRFYAVRAAACPARLPPRVLAEDAYLTVRLGRARLARERTALVYFRPPVTWREYLHDRVRNEVAKLQLAREFPDLLAVHGVDSYPWRTLLGTLRLSEYGLLVLAVGARLYAKTRARLSVRTGIRTSWTLLPSTKRWD